jgi:ATP adenylyltransferase
MSYVGKRPVGCVFCAKPEETDRDSLIVERRPLSYTVLNLYPYNTAHLLIVPFRHVANLSDLNAPERQELIETAANFEARLREIYRPDGINVGLNLGQSAGAGIAPHLHLHVVPRWNGDANFLSVVGETRVLPEELHTTWQRLRDRQG